MENRDAVISPAYIDDVSDAAVNLQRLDLLRETNPTEDRRLLQEYHCNLVSLFASCAEGENRFSKSQPSFAGQRPFAFLPLIVND